MVVFCTTFSGLGVAEAGLDGEVAHKLPVNTIKLAPAIWIVAAAVSEKLKFGSQSTAAGMTRVLPK
jgi:hypothetical protein